MSKQTLGQRWAFLQKHLTRKSIDRGDLHPDNYDPTIRPQYCDSFSSLLNCLSEKLVLNPASEMALATLIATHISTPTGGIPLWMFIVGLAASGKTTLLDLISARHTHAHVTTKLTGLHSGFRMGHGPKTSDCSLFSLIKDKSLVIKDFTPILTMSPVDRERVFGEFRTAFDGENQMTYRNNVKYDHQNVRFTVLAAVTNAIHEFNTTTLGERMLKVTIDHEWGKDGMPTVHETSGRVVNSAIYNMLSSIAEQEDVTSGHLTLQKGVTWGFLEYLSQVIHGRPDFLRTIGHNIGQDSKIIAFIESLAKILEACRAMVTGEHQYRPRPQAETRVAAQLAKLMVMLCVVKGIDGPDQWVLHAVRKVAFDTVISNNQIIMAKLSLAKDSGGFTLKDIQANTHLSDTYVNRLVQDLITLGLVREMNIKAINTETGFRRQGRPSKFYGLAPTLHKAYTNVNSMLTW